MSGVAIEMKGAWSATRLKSYLACPRLYRYSYVDGIPAVPTAPLVFGRTLHEVLCFGHEHQMLGGQLPPIAALIARFDALWQEAIDTEKPMFREGSTTPPEYVRLGHEILRAYVVCPCNADPPLAVELAFEVEVGGYRFTGIVDRLEECETGLVVVDYKSGARKPRETEIQGDLQFTLYALAIEAMLGRPVERVVYYQLRDGSRYDVIPDPQRATQLVEEVVPQVAQGIERGEFAPRPGYWCNWCDYRELCCAENATRVEEKR